MALVYYVYFKDNITQPVSQLTPGSPFLVARAPTNPNDLGHADAIGTVSRTCYNFNFSWQTVVWA